MKNNTMNTIVKKPNHEKRRNNYWPDELMQNNSCKSREWLLIILTLGRSSRWKKKN